MYLPGLITPAAEAQELSLEIIMSTSVEFNVKKVTRQQCTEEPDSWMLIRNLQYNISHGEKWIKDIKLRRKEDMSYSLVVRTLDKYLCHLPTCNSTDSLKMSFFTGMFQGFRSQMQNNYFVEQFSIVVSVDVEIH